MKNCIIIFIAVAFTGCFNSKAKIDVGSDQDYIIVEAKRKIHHQDGSLSYADYKPFITRTIDFSHTYTKQQSLPKLCKYGGLLSKRTDSTGFLYTKKIDNRWWCVDPEGYFYVNVALNSIVMGKSEGKNMP